MVLASLLVPATLLGTAWIPAAELPTATTRESDRQASGEPAVAATGRRHHSGATFDDAIAASDHRSRTVATLYDAVDHAADPTGHETVDGAANAAQLPAAAGGAAAQYAQADDQAGKATLVTRTLR